MEDKSQLILTRSEKKLLMKILSSFLDKSVVETESTVIETILSKLKSKDKVVLYIDGAAMPDGQGAGIGGVCYKSEKKIFSFSEFIGNRTNNEAEYFALIQGLSHALEKEIQSITIYSDSQLIVNQINGKYQVKNERMILCYQKATNILSNFNSWTLIHIPREKNKEADFLSKQGLQI